VTAPPTATLTSSERHPECGPGALPADGRSSRMRTAPPSVFGAVVFATAGEDSGAPAAALPWDDGTLLGRGLAQLASIGVRSADVVMRPGAEAALASSLRVDGISVRTHVSPDTAGDLRVLAGIARSGTGGLALLQGDVVTHREALAGLLLDPRLRTAALVVPGGQGRPFAPRVRSVRGHVLSAGSPYHHVKDPTTNFLGILKVAAAERILLAGTAERLAALVEDPPPSWSGERDATVDAWRRWFARRSDPEATEIPERPVLGEDDEAEVRRAASAAGQDVVSLALVGLVRGGAAVGISHLRRLFWARPLSAAAAAAARAQIEAYDEDRVLLDSAVKANDGFFTTYFVSPYSKYLARWAARRGWTPNGVTTLSLAIGTLAAAAYATGTGWGMVAGAVLLQASFTTDCVDGQLARYTRQFSALGAWLDSVFDRTKEYLVFAGLAIGASAADGDVWLLAAAALSLQTVRHTLEFSYGASRQQGFAAVLQPPLEVAEDAGGPRRPYLPPSRPPGERPRPARPPARRVVGRGLALWTAIERLPGIRWGKKMVAFPIGERFALISIVSVISGPRTTFIAYLAWAGLATVYNLVGRVLRSIAR